MKIKPSGKQDWAKQNGENVKASVYKNVYQKPPKTEQLPMFKPKAQPISTDAKFHTVSNYKGEYVGKSVKPPTPIRPRSSHRDQVTDVAFGGETTVSKSYRPFTDEEARNARIRFKRVGSSHGRIDPHNPNKFAGASTFSADFTQHGYSRQNQIRPVENNIEFGKDGGEHNTTHQIDYAPISGNQRQAPFKPKNERLQSKYEVPYVTTTRGDYIGHSGLHRSADYAPDRGYKPSSTPFTKESAYMGTYRALPVSKREEKPWADAAKRLTNLYAKETDQTAPSCYSSDFQTKGNAKRDPIKPERMSWTDRPKFDASSLYQQQFVGKIREPTTSYKPNHAYRKPSKTVDGLSTTMESYRGEFVLPPQPFKPANTTMSNNDEMAKSTEYGDRFK